MKYKKPTIKNLSQFSLAFGDCAGGSAVGNPKYCLSGSINIGPCTGGGAPSGASCAPYGESALTICSTGHKAS